MIAERTDDEDEAEDEVDDLADLAAAYPVVRKRLDFSRLNVRELLSLGDVEDMARELGTDPGRLQSVLAADGADQRIGLDVGLVIAWIIGRKADPELTLDYVRRFWYVEFVGIGTADPSPARTRTRRSSGRAGSSPTRG
jgi:hypothetical protein